MLCGYATATVAACMIALAFTVDDEKCPYLKFLNRGMRKTTSSSSNAVSLIKFCATMGIDFSVLPLREKERLANAFFNAHQMANQPFSCSWS